MDVFDFGQVEDSFCFQYFLDYQDFGLKFFIVFIIDVFDFGQEEDFDSIVPSQGGPHFGFRSPIVFSSMESSFSGILLLLCVFFLSLLLETFIIMYILICLRYYPLLCVCCFLVEKFYSVNFFSCRNFISFFGFFVGLFIVWF